MAYNRLENPPLWIWAVIVGGIIAGKFIYRWQLTKQFAKEDQEKYILMIKQKTSRKMTSMTAITKDMLQIWGLTSTTLGITIKIALR
jgi:uncharacterized protein YneF (UPF0154 family)